MAHLLLSVYVWLFSLLCTHFCAFAVLLEAEVRIHDCFANGCLWVNLPVVLRWSKDGLSCLWVRNQCLFLLLWSDSGRTWLSLLLRLSILRVRPPASRKKWLFHHFPHLPTSALATQCRWQIRLLIMEIRMSSMCRANERWHERSHIVRRTSLHLKCF